MDNSNRNDPKWPNMPGNVTQTVLSTCNINPISEADTF